MTFSDPLIETIKKLLDSSFNGCVVNDEETIRIIEQANGAGAPDQFHVGFGFKSGMLRTQVCKKWHNEKLKDCDQDWVEKQIKEFDIGAKKALTEWTNYWISSIFFLKKWE